jgi:hypothetical protein
MTETQVTEPRTLPEPLDDSQTGTPARQPGSVRRTSSIDMVWPGGFGTPLHLVGHARDLITTVAGDAVVVERAQMRATIGDDRRVEAIETVPERIGIEGLVGAQGGGYLRVAIDRVLPGERQAATPLYLLLDDMAGTSLIAGFAWMRHRPPDAPPRERPTELGVRKGRIICSGLRPGGSAHVAFSSGEHGGHAMRHAGPLVVDGDTLAWHEFPERPVVCVRRQRRVDVIPDGDELMVDAFFRDSSWEPDGTEMVLHEYTVSARVDAATLTLAAVAARPHVLPFPECQWAPEHVTLLLGKPVQTFRTDVQTTLMELQACTHLNDMLRCLAEVPALADALNAQS